MNRVGDAVKGADMNTNNEVTGRPSATQMDDVRVASREREEQMNSKPTTTGSEQAMNESGEGGASNETRPTDAECAAREASKLCARLTGKVHVEPDVWQQLALMSPDDAKHDETSATLKECAREIVAKIIVNK